MAQGVLRARVGNQWVDITGAADFIPLGSMYMYAGDVEPASWMFCRGQAIFRDVYASLFTLIGTRFGTGDGSTTFNLPNLQQRLPLGAAGTDIIGAVGGSRDSVVVGHTHPVDHNHASATSGAQSASHTHAGVDHLHTINHDHATATSSTGSANHDHGIPATTVVMHALGSGILATGTSFAGGTNTHVDEGAAHTHTVNLPSFAGSSGAADRALTTGGQSVSHTHAIDLAAYTGASGAASGAASGVGANLPPYLIINFIMKVQ